MPDVAAVLAALGDIPAETQPQKVKRRSRDFYWYSPVLKRRLDGVTADAVVTPRSEAEVVAVLAQAFAHGVPVTARGAGTGNYGQAMPLHGGIVLDLSELKAVERLEPGRVRAQAGIRLVDLETATKATCQELRFHPSTLRTASLGGFVAGGSSGVGSITWGLLRDPGNILAARVVTMEAEPRILELRGADIQQVNHAYGTNGIITALEMPLAPAYRWVELVLAFEGFPDAVRFADALARCDGIAKKLATPIAAPAPQQYLFPDLVRPGESVILVLVADIARDALAVLLAGWPARIAFEGYQDERRPAEEMLFERSWNHTTLHALKHDRTVTYLQTLFPPPRHVDLALQMAERFGDEVPSHLEFVRFGGEVACFGLQLVRYTTEERLAAIIEAHEAAGCPIFNPHDFTLEGGGMKKVDQAQLAFKREADPKGLLNPGKMLAWDDPELAGQSSRRWLYDAPDAGAVAGLAGESMAVRLDADTAATRLEELASLLIDAVADGASVGFMASIDAAEARAFWRLVAQRGRAGELHQLAALDGAGRLVGTVLLVPASMPNQPHRADVAKLLVHRSARGRGVARALMAALEVLAIERGRTLLVLDTIQGSPADRLYRGLGWTAAGAIPDYALMPDGEPRPTVVFWKRLGA